ncbi:MAG TPA: tonB-system energizer ExbB, partial [Xanthobacteraceae bacterium]|nr:tonB-system energizer ExbB [Xanthobacteraceae bacterium]
MAANEGETNPMTVSPRKLVRRHVQLPARAPAPARMGRSLAVEDRLRAARTARSERLTISRKHNKAQHTEKAVVFHYSKVKQGAFLQSRWGGSSLLEAGADGGDGKVSGNSEMRTDRKTRTSRKIGVYSRGRRLALASLSALFVAASLVHSVHAQAPAAQSPAAQVPGTQIPSAPVPATSTPTQPPPTAAAPAPQSPSPQTQAPAAPSEAAPPARAAEPSVTPAPPAGGSSIGGDLLPRQLSYTRMFLDADWVVKAVMIGLAFASLVSWTVWLAKTWELARGRREVRRGVRTLLESPTLARAHDQLHDGGTPVSQLMQAAAQEIRLSTGVRGDGLKERISWQLERLEMGFSRRMARGTGVLATIGSTAPFVGLFGTVWGIMNSFIGISNAHTTNLAVVA